MHEWLMAFGYAALMIAFIGVILVAMMTLASFLHPMIVAGGIMFVTLVVVLRYTIFTY